MASRGISESGGSHHVEGRRARRRLWRTALAILLAPALGGAILGAGIAVFEFGLQTLVVGAAFGAFIGAGAGIPLIATFGLLFDWAARRRGWTRWWHYVLGGAVAGILGLACIAIYDAFFSSTSLLPPSHWIAMFEFVAGGTIVAGLAWLIRRPDKD